MSNWCLHTTGYLSFLDDFSVEQGACSVTPLGKASFCLHTCMQKGGSMSRDICVSLVFFFPACWINAV